MAKTNMALLMCLKSYPVSWFLAFLRVTNPAALIVFRMVMRRSMPSGESSKGTGNRIEKNNGKHAAARNVLGIKVKKMTVITAAIKHGKVSISADTQLNFGSTQVNAKYLNHSSKLIRVNNSVIGVTGWSATCQVLEHLAKVHPERFKLNSRWEIFETLLGLHEKFKDDYFIETSEGRNQPVESNQIDGIIVNQYGLFEFGSYREVHQYEHFWSTGSGRRFALGAMHAMYDSSASAQEIAEAGAKAAAEFDDSCNLPLNTTVIDLVNTH